MENTSLVALSRQLVLRRKLDVIANNVANIDTSGFKREALELDEYDMPVSRANTFPRRDRTLSFVEDWTTTTDHKPGAIETTGNPFDIAIQGSGFFVVQTPAGERYTRAGDFMLDANGRLVTNDGKPVLGEGGEIVFQANETDVVIGADGSIASNVGPRGRLRVVDFADVRALTKEGENLFSGEGAVPAEAARVQQGALEKSNVEAVIEMTRLIEVNRSYEQISRMIGAHDELRTKAIERLGDVRA
ncbi:flagellar basal-body rod protein FlgF [Chthonobacter rhizosphaerae]|uniref:flagellar basal-body rod protein FlgF n=1 Tax=Chthonobacter rhizosphaerae TaxID=2735553 RepID=UPI0015EEBD6B|nr:flagellar basal-body rod protein FlgF [Chthonobacter rhizosphaerae]